MTRISSAALLLLATLAAACSDPPKLDPKGDIAGKITVTDGDLQKVFVSIPGAVTTPDGEGRFSFRALPPGSYEVSASKEGWQTASATAAVTDGATASVELTLVKEVPDNGAPVLTSFSAVPALFARKEKGRLLALATDPDGDTLTYTFTAGEGWTVETAGEPGVATVTAPDTSGASTTVRVSVSDGRGGKVEGALLVTTSANRAPVVSSFVARASQLVPGGTTELLVSAADPDGDALTYSWSAPEGWSVTAQGTRATIVAPESYDAQALVEVTVSDADGAKATSSVALTTVANQSPVFSSIVARPSVVRPGAASTLVAAASDPNGDALTYGWTVPEGWSLVGEGAQVTVTAPDTHDAQATVEVTADDGHGRSAKASVIVATTPNAAPLLTSLTATPPQARPGATIQLKASATDADGEPLTFAWTAPQGWTLSGTGSTVSLVAPARYGAVGEVSLEVTDPSGAKASASVVVSTATNSGPAVTSAVALPAQAAPKGEVRVVVAALDPDGDTLTYQWTAPQGWTLKSGATASEAVLVAPDQYGRSDTALVTVSDGTASATASVVVSTRTNRAPVVASIGARPSPLRKGGTATVDVSASDPDGDALGYSWRASQGWSVSGEGATVTVTAPDSYAASGTITVEVADGYGLVARAQLPVSTVENHAPQLLALTASGSPADRNGTINLLASAADLDGDALTYRWIAPQGWTMVGTGSQVRLTAPNLLSQRGTVTVEVVDVGGLVATGTVDVATKDNRPPTVTGLSATPTSPLPGAVTVLAAVGSDPDGETLSYEWASSDTNWTLVGAGSSVGLRAPYTNGASTTITVTARDPSGGSAVRTLLVTAASCSGTSMNCDGDVSNGCEVQLDSDAENCGRCANSCSAPTPACFTGSCTDVVRTSCKTIKQSVPASPSGIYSIDSDGAGPRAPLNVYCDMTTDDGGWTLALVQPVTTNWGCLTPSLAPPTSPTATSSNVLHYSVFNEIGATEMYVTDTGSNRILKFYYPRTGTPFLSNYRNFTERTCFNSVMDAGDAPHTGTSRSGYGHAGQACTTANYAGFKARSDCREDSTNSYPAWGDSPGQSTSYFGGSDCWLYGGTTMTSVPLITNCPTSSRAPWATYTGGTLSGTLVLWVR